MARSVISAPGGSAPLLASPPATPAGEAQNLKLYLPYVVYNQPLQPDNPANCPCGWFAADGRMLDLVQPD